MKVIKVLGTGCASCRNLEIMVRNIVNSQRIDAQVIKEEDIMKIISYGVRRTPALVIDEKVVMHGRVPSEAEIVTLLVNNE